MGGPGETSGEVAVVVDITLDAVAKLELPVLAGLLCGKPLCRMLVGGTLYWMVVPDGIVIVCGNCCCICGTPCC